METANRIVTTVVGLILIIASILKVHQLLTEPIISRGLWESWEFFLIQIPLELGLGIWLLSGLFRKAVWLVAVISFGLFSLVTLQKIIIGAESCGCFGRVQVDPWITFFAIDILFLFALLIFRPKGRKFLPPPWPSAGHFFGIAIPTFVIMAVIMPVLIFNRPPDKTDTYEVVRHQEWTSREPTSEEQTSQKQTSQEQVSEEWPMLKHIDIADSLRSKIVVVLFYHNDCPDCQEAISLYDRTSRQLAGNEDAVRIAFIEVPPYGPDQDSLIPHETLCLTGRLDSTKQWYITTPLVVVILDGYVVKSWQEEVPQLDEILNAVFAGS